MASAFERDWNKTYGSNKPAGWMLRKARSLPWVRFHSLPESKRYPANGDEEEIVLYRARILGDLILGKKAACWQVECCLTGTTQPHLSLPATCTIASQFADDDCEWDVYVSQVTWRSETFASTLLAIANSEAASTLWMNRETGEIFAPYDGGFDLFPSSGDQVAKLRSDFAEWLSSHPEGL